MYQITMWHGLIKPENRNSRNTSGPTSFNEIEDAVKYWRRVRAGGGQLVGEVKEVKGRHGFQSLEEFDSMGRMTADELSLLGQEMRLGRPPE